MRIGFDLDGVLADFNTGFANKLIDVTGENKFSWFDNLSQPPCWDWPKAAGYTSKQIDATWRAVDDDPSFWMSLLPLRGVADFNAADGLFEEDVDVYFVTKRDSPTAKDQSEVWLADQIHLMYPTVLITGDKGLACKVLRLDAYIDDKVENVQAVVKESSWTHAYLLDQPWNRHAADIGWTRVHKVEDMLIAEHLSVVEV